MEIDYTNPFPQDSPEAKALIERAQRLDQAADRAFVRWFNGEVASAAAASRVQNLAEEAWADVRLGIVNGDIIEAREQGLSQGDA